MPASLLAPIPRVTLTLDEAAKALSMSRRFFDAHVRSDVRVIRLGSGIGERRKTYVAVKELERWADSCAYLLADGPSVSPRAVTTV